MPKKLILIIGPPGAGKSTECKLLTEKHKDDIDTYSVTNIIKERIAENSAIGKLMNKYVLDGDLVPSDLIMHEVIDLIKNGSKDIVLIDGLPRGLNQMKTLGDAIHMDDNIQLVAVIEIKVSPETARKRRLSNNANQEEISVFEHKMDIYNDLLEEIEAYYKKNDLLTIIDGEKDSEVVVTEIDEFLTKQVSLFDRE
ncbi:MAG: adenylate kinase [Campylobacterota bacterium]|nr:adenylate kinase [Campylobacterota bacterium]